MDELEFTDRKEFVPLLGLLKEDNDKIKELKTLYQQEEKYVSFFGPIESFLAYFYLDNPKIKDIDVIRAIKNVRMNYNKNPEFFKNSFEKELIGVTSLTLQKSKKKITKHELFLVFGYILWSIDNRRWMGDSRGYLNWIVNFFGLYNKEEKNKYDLFYNKLGKRFNINDQAIRSMKDNEGDFELPVANIILDKLDSAKFSEYENEGDNDEEDENEDDEESIWGEGAYIESLDIHAPDFQERMKYFEEKKDEEKNLQCKKCNIPIGKHNLYWHEGMCNECFFDTYDM